MEMTERIPLLITRVGFTGSEEDGKPLVVTLKCRDLEGKRVTLSVTDSRPALWVDSQPLWGSLPDFADADITPAFTSLEGDPLWRIRVDYPEQRSVVAKLFNRTYSNDVPYEQAVRWMYGWRSTIEVDKWRINQSLRPVHIHESDVDPGLFDVRCFTFDIETWDEGAFVQPDKATNRIVSIAIHDSTTDTYEVGTSAKGTSERSV